MKPHIRKVRGIWTVRECLRVERGALWTGSPPAISVPTGTGPIGHGYTVREAYEDWRIQMEAQRA